MVLGRTADELQLADHLHPHVKRVASIPPGAQCQRRPGFQIVELCRIRSTHALPNRVVAATTTWSGSNPNSRWSSLSGAEAPNVFIAITWTDLPTYRSHPKVEACAIATRALTPGGSTLSRYSCVWFSKISHEGMETTRDRMRWASSLVWASTARLNSLPEAIRITSGFPPGGSASTYAPRATPVAGA